MQPWQGINNEAMYNFQASQTYTGTASGGNTGANPQAPQFAASEWPQTYYQQANFFPSSTTGYYSVPTSDVNVAPSSSSTVDSSGGATNLETEWPWSTQDDPQPTLIPHSSVKNLPTTSFNDVEITDQLCEIIQIDSDDECPAPSKPPDQTRPQNKRTRGLSPQTPSYTPDQIHPQNPIGRTYDSSSTASSYTPDQTHNQNRMGRPLDLSRNAVNDVGNKRLVETTRDIHVNTSTSEKHFTTTQVSNVTNNVQPCFQQQRVHKQRNYQGDYVSNNTKLEDQWKWEEHLLKYVQTNQIQRRESPRESTSKIPVQAGPMYVNGPLLHIPQPSYTLNKENCRPIDENRRKIIFPSGNRDQVPRKVEFQDVNLPVIYANELRQCAKKLGAENNGGMFIYVADKFGNFHKQPLLNTHLAETPAKTICMSERKENVVYNVGTQLYDKEKHSATRKKSIQLKAIGQNVTQIFHTHDLPQKKENTNTNISLPLRLPIPVHDSVKCGGKMPMNKVTPGRGILQTVNMNDQQRNRDNELRDTSTIIFDPERCGKAPITNEQHIKVVYVSEQQHDKRDNEVQFLYGIDKSGRMCPTEVVIPKYIIEPVEKKEMPYGDTRIVIQRPINKIPNVSHNNVQQTVVQHVYERPLTADDFNMDESILRNDPELREELQTFQRNLRNSLCQTEGK